MDRYGPCVSIGIGISFSFVAGFTKRAPAAVQRLGIEWAHRLWCEPRRLWRRYLLRGPGFLPFVACAAMRDRCDRCGPYCRPFNRSNGRK